MQLLEGYIKAEWHESVARPDGFFISPTAEQSRLIEHTEGVVERLEEGLKTDEFYEELAKAHNVDRLYEGTVEADNLAALLAIAEVEESATNFSDEFLFDETVESSWMLLIGSAVRRAKAKAKEPVSLSLSEWSQAAFEDRDQGPDDVDSEGSWYEHCSGIDDPELQQKTLSLVSSGIILSGVLTNPEKVVWRGEVVTLQTSVPAQ